MIYNYLFKNYKRKTIFFYPAIEKSHEKFIKTLTNLAVEKRTHFEAGTGREKGREILPRPQSLKPLNADGVRQHYDQI